MVETMSFGLNSQTSEVQFDSVVATPQISIMTENGLIIFRNSARATKALYDEQDKRYAGCFGAYLALEWRQLACVSI